jgi:HSP20 family protein
MKDNLPDDPWLGYAAIGGSPERGDQLEGARPSPEYWLPAADRMETDEAYVFEIELPGVERKDIVLELLPGSLTVRGARPGLNPADARVLKQERSRGFFLRRFPLPGEVDPEAAFASLGQGLLTVTLPKRGGPRRIAVEDGS